LVSQPLPELEGQALSDVHNRERLGSILVTYPDVKVSYVELMEAVHSREQLRQVTNGNAFSEVIVSNDPPNQLSIRHSGANIKYTAIMKAYSCHNYVNLVMFHVRNVYVINITNSQFHDNDEVPSTLKSIVKFDNVW
jgi:hypothetical protein